MTDDLEARFRAAEARVEELEQENKHFRSGLIQIIQMERYPRDSSRFDILDGLFPTGEFALKVLNGVKRK